MASGPFIELLPQKVLAIQQVAQLLYSNTLIRVIMFNFPYFQVICFYTNYFVMKFITNAIQLDIFCIMKLLQI